MRKNFIFFLLILVQYAVGQTGAEKLIKGRVSAGNVLLEGITIVNSNSKATTISDSNGGFVILVKEGDILHFSAVNYEELRKYIKNQEFKLGVIAVDLTPKRIQLDEVVINDESKLDAVDLGILSKMPVKLTPAERRLKTAGEFKPIQLLGILGGALPVDPILNAISGRTKMLKKELSIEKKELLMAKLDKLFEDKYYIETLKIPEDYIRGFQYYCVEDTDFARSLNEKNRTMSMFLITALANSFNKNRGSNAD